MQHVPARVLAYVRVSTDEQERHGSSLDGQQEQLRRWCSARGWPEPRVYLEVESGSAERLEARVELGRLLAAARPGDAVVTIAVDRWSRDLPWGVASVRALVRRGIGWIATGDGVDASTPDGDTHLGMRAMFADMERKRIRDRTRGARKFLRDRGQSVEGLVAYAYRRTPRAVGAPRTLVVVPEEAELVRDMHRRAGAGASIRDIINALPPRDPPWNVEGIRRVLTSRTYLGEMKNSRGEWIVAHPPIITLETWERTRAALQGRRNGGRPPESMVTRDWLLRGIAQCALCRSRMSCTVATPIRVGGELTGYRYKYYTCASRTDANRRCGNRSHHVGVIDPEVESRAVARLEELRALLAAAPAQRASDDTSGIAKRRAGLIAQRDRAIRLSVEGVIEPSDLRKQLERIDASLEALLAEEARRRAVPVASPEARRRALADVSRLRDAWRALGPEQRREVLSRALAREVLLGPDGLALVWRTPEELASEHVA